MSRYKAIAFDFDGTLTLDGSLAPATRDALASARARGHLLILATGRIVSELLDVLPDAADLFDAVVAENGAVLVSRDRVRHLAPPVAPALLSALSERGVQVRAGEVLLACHVGDEAVVMQEVGRLGLEDRPVRNRGELMVLPAGVSKATGVRAALEEAGISWHNLAAMGDAENDHAMLYWAELGAVPANAVDSLKVEADVVFDLTDGDAVVELLARPALREDSLSPPRHDVLLGRSASGEPVVIPPAAKVLIAGGTRSGKSRVAGLLVERLVEAEYVGVVLDAEGDHGELGRLPGVVAFEADQVQAEPGLVTGAFRHRFLSVVLDLLPLTTQARRHVVSSLVPVLGAHRRRLGTPHWVVVDEAHLFLGDTAVATSLLQTTDSGAVLVTFRPAALPPSVLDRIDVVLLRPFGDSADDLRACAAIGGAAPDELAAVLSGLRRGQVAALRRSGTGGVQVIDLLPRVTAHVRHHSKYAEKPLPWHLGFHFCRFEGDPAGPVALSMDDFDRMLHRCAPEVVRHHALRADFSRWVADVLGDTELATHLAGAEAALAPGRSDAGDDPAVEATRAALLDAVEERYLR